MQSLEIAEKCEKAPQNDQICLIFVKIAAFFDFGRKNRSCAIFVFLRHGSPKISAWL